MASSRRKRFERLLGLRDRELEQRKGDAARSRVARNESQEALLKSQEALKQAASGYRVGSGQSRMAADFEVVGAWLKQQVSEVEKAMIYHKQACERLRLTTLEVQKAQKAKRQIETLLLRVTHEEDKERNVAEQKEQDELATRLSFYRS